MERQKERIAHYWGQRSEGFRQAHQGEWDSPTASVYREVISSHLSKPGQPSWTWAPAAVFSPCS